MELVSHRARGFGADENTLDAFVAALKAGAGAEIDTRVTGDGVVIVHHDRFLKGRDGRVVAIDTTPLKDLQTIMPGIAPLADFIAAYRDAGTSATLMLDLKSGREVDRHAELALSLPSSRQVQVVSWRPDVVARLCDRLPAGQVGFSHMPLSGQPLIHAAARALLCGGARRILGTGMSLFVPRLAREWMAMRTYGSADKPCDDADAAVGILTRGAATGKLVDRLRAHGGMMLVPLGTSRAVLAAYRSAGLRLTLFSGKTEDNVREAREKQADYLLCDNPALLALSPRGRA